MKKFIFLILLCIPFLLSSCSITSFRTLLLGHKPNTYFYTNELVEKINKDGITEINVLQTNLQKEKTFSKDDITTFKDFFSYIKTNDFKTSIKDLPDKPKYKLYVSTKHNKFVLNIYTDKYISVFPWDGTYQMDYIDMSNVKSLYNIYSLCEYIYKD